MLQITTVFLACCASSSAFSPPLMSRSSLFAISPPKAPTSNSRASKTSMLRMSTETERTTEVKEVAAPAFKSAIAKRSDLEKESQMMDAGIFNFNKKLIDTVYDIICFIYPVTGTKRDFARFFVLETVARVPYFAYLSVLHLRETFGERGVGDKMRTHYAEADNELHHLLIMESLGGNDSAIDRTVAQAMAFGYYWYVVIIYFFNEPAAYHLSELIENHAFDTYSGFLNDHGERLKTMPVPEIAQKYYVDDNPFLFDLFCTVKNLDDDGNFSTRRPKLESLYDVFVNIRDDEKEHWKTLCNLVQYGDMQGVENSAVKSTNPIEAEVA